MDPDLLKLKISILASLTLAVCFGAFVAQRFWYYLRTRNIDSVESVRVKLFPEWTLMVVSGFLLWFGMAGLSVISGLSGFTSVAREVVLCELEVAAAGPQGFTLLVYDRIDAEAPSAARMRGVMVSGSQDFEVEVQRVGFGTLLAMVGQNELVRVCGVRQVGATAVMRARPTRESEGDGLEVTLAPAVPGGVLLWPFMPQAESIVLEARDLKAGDVLSLETDGAGGVRLVRKA
jgi:hypothetical protein